MLLFRLNSLPPQMTKSMPSPANYIARFVRTPPWMYVRPPPVTNGVNSFAKCLQREKRKQRSNSILLIITELACFPNLRVPEPTGWFISSRLWLLLLEPPCSSLLSERGNGRQRKHPQNQQIPIHQIWDPSLPK